MQINASDLIHTFQRFGDAPCRQNWQADRHASLQRLPAQWQQGGQRHSPQDAEPSQ